MPSKIPTPERKRVVLVNAEGEATRHVYTETRVARAGNGYGYEHIFTCTKTNARRRYGIENGPGLPADEPEVEPVREPLTDITGCDV